MSTRTINAKLCRSATRRYPHRLNCLRVGSASGAARRIRLPEPVTSRNWSSLPKRSRCCVIERRSRWVSTARLLYAMRDCRVLPRRLRTWPLLCQRVRAKPIVSASCRYAAVWNQFCCHQRLLQGVLIVDLGGGNDVPENPADEGMNRRSIIVPLSVRRSKPPSIR